MTAAVDLQVALHLAQQTTPTAIRKRAEGLRASAEMYEITRADYTRAASAVQVGTLEYRRCAALAEVMAMHIAHFKAMAVECERIARETEG